MTARVWLVAAFALAFVAAPLAAEAQRAAKVPRIGVLFGTSPSVGAPFIEAFRQGLGDLGYVEGKNIAIESRWAEGRYDRYPDFATELLLLKVDVIVAGNTPAAQAAQNATGTILIVMVIVADPVGSGLVASLARPAGNITGLSFLAVDLVAKQLELLKEAVPKASRVAILRNPTLPAHALMLREGEVAARSLRVQLQILEVRGPDEFESAFATMTRERAGAVLVLTDAMFFLHRARLADLAAKHRLPAMYGVVDHAGAGGLMAYAVDARDNWRRAAAYVDKILKGARPADLPVEQPTRMEFVINLKTSKALGLTIPQSVLIRADRVIQ